MVWADTLATDFSAAACVVVCAACSGRVGGVRRGCEAVSPPYHSPPCSEAHPGELYDLGSLGTIPHVRGRGATSVYTGGARRHPSTTVHPTMACGTVHPRHTVQPTRSTRYTRLWRVLRRHPRANLRDPRVSWLKTREQ